MCSGSSSNGGQSRVPAEQRAAGRTAARLDHERRAAAAAWPGPGWCCRRSAGSCPRRPSLQAVVQSRSGCPSGSWRTRRKLNLSIFGNWSCQPICFMYESTRPSSGFLAGFRASSPNCVADLLRRPLDGQHGHAVDVLQLALAGLRLREALVRRERGGRQDEGQRAGEANRRMARLPGRAIPRWPWSGRGPRRTRSAAAPASPRW